ncbi:MAG: hypothetical protein MUE52_05740 [Tabrizicola sp.]|jgi:hypothetical protein|nr:hypothetical protein [Tabrizicola sp.]
MARVLITVMLLTASGPAAAFDLAGFLATMSMGKPVTEEPAPVRVVTTVEDEAPPVQKARPKQGAFAPDAVWMIGVFR